MLVNTDVLRPYLAMVRAVLYEYSCMWSPSLIYCTFGKSEKLCRRKWKANVYSCRIPVLGLTLKPFLSAASIPVYYLAIDSTTMHSRAVEKLCRRIVYSGSCTVSIQLYIDPTTTAWPGVMEGIPSPEAVCSHVPVPVRYRCTTCRLYRY